MAIHGDHDTFVDYDDDSISSTKKNKQATDPADVVRESATDGADSDGACVVMRRCYSTISPMTSTML